MALVLFRDEVKQIEISKKMFPPKKVDNLEQWFRQACRTIREIPADHTVVNTQVSPKWIVWELNSPKGERSYVVIDRRAPSIG